MIPASYLSPAQATTVLSQLQLGFGTFQPSAYIASDFGVNGWNVIPSLPGLPVDLVNRVLSSYLVSSTSVIDTTGLATDSITKLNGIRSRIPAAMTALHDDQGTPLQNPYLGLTAGTAAYNHVTDAIINVIFRFDSRYLLRKRVDNSIGAWTENVVYELPSAFHMTNHPMILARLKPHGFDDTTNIDDTGTAGAYRITTTTNHGYYTGQSVATTGTNVAATVVQEFPAIVNLTQTNSGDIGGVTTSKFTVSGAQNFITGQAVVTDGATGWGIFDWHPKRYVKRLSATEVELYRDSALTDKIIPGWGNLTAVYSTTYNNILTMAVKTSGTHMMFDDLPQIMDSSSSSVGIFERKFITGVDPGTGVFTTTGSGYSIVDGQITNFAGMNDGNAWQNLNDTDLPLYFRKLTATTFALYLNENLTTLWRPGQDAVNNVTGFTTASGAYSVSVTANTPIISGQSFRIDGTGTDFSALSSITNFDTSTSVFTLAANHNLEDGQPVELFGNNTGSGSPGITINSVFYVAPTNYIWAKTTGLGANQFKLYKDAGLTTVWTPVASGGSLAVSGYYQMAFYAKYVSSTKFDLFVDPNLTNPYNQTVSTTGFTAGKIIATSHIGFITTSNNTSYIQPMFYCYRDGYDSATLWANKTRTLAFPFFGKNGSLNYSTAVFGAYNSTASVYNNQLVEDQITAQATPQLNISYLNVSGIYRINGIAYNDATSGFVSGAKALTGHFKPVYWAKKITNKVVELYVDEAMTTTVRSGGATPNAPAIVTPATFGNFQITWFDANRYRLDTITCVSTGGERFFYDDYTANANTPTQVANATWNNRTDNYSYKFYTDHNTTNTIATLPVTSVYEYASTAAGQYYGQLRKTKASGADTTTSAITIDPAVYGGIGSPLVYQLEFPGQFQFANEFLFGVNANETVGTYTADPLLQTGDKWVTADNTGAAGTAGNIGQYTRLWPNTVKPATLTWTIEQPTQTLESQNFTRYVRSKDITQYRIKLTYPPMTMEQFRPFLAVITAARGGFKPVRYTPPQSTYTSRWITINVNKRNATVPENVRGRLTVEAGQQIMKLDGLPPNLTAAYSAGHALEISQQNSTGGWALPIHDVWTNAYGEANIRVNNSLAMKMYFGNRIISDASGLDCFIDNGSIDIKVDTLGYHYLDIDLITKRVF